MVEVGRFDTRTDAEFARSLLAAAGIPCVLAPEQGHAVAPGGPRGGARLLVADADAHDAGEILSRAEIVADRPDGDPMPRMEIVLPVSASTDDGSSSVVARLPV